MADGSAEDISKVLVKKQYFEINSVTDEVRQNGLNELQDLLKNHDKIKNSGLRPLITKLTDYFSDTSNRLLTMKSVQIVSLLA